jgi:GR25 family glycosyltransferase involved in LPS biosynthesis|tara:strand:- start:808 stop:1404 length:597 start_codon:yes stop_codon:yes gene_type:complete
MTIKKINKNNIIVLIIHLNKAIDRKDNINKIKSIFKNVIIIDAIYGLDLSKEEYEKENNKLITYHNTKETFRRGKIGCYLSHIKSLKYIIDNKLDNVLILEDDAEILFNDFEEINIEDNIYQLYLGGQFFNKKLILTHSIFYPKYEYTKKIYDTLLERKRYRAIDIEFANIIHTKFNIKLNNPIIFKQMNNFSYIKNK